jgi:hypothetical protein
MDLKVQAQVAANPQQAAVRAWTFQTDY